jgi:hypothetical protein
MNKFGASSAFKAVMIASGGLSGGLSSAIAGGNFWSGVREGLITAGLNHVVHSVVDGGGEGDPKKGNKRSKSNTKGSLKDSHGEKVYSLEEWYQTYNEKSYLEITTEKGYIQGLPAGPIKRYVKNPIDGNVMDMRHVSVVGYGMGEMLGDGVEHVQYATGDGSNSAYDIQDYYSNKIGAYYYQLRQSGSWASDSWAYDFKRFILTHYDTLKSIIIPKK